MEDLAECEKDLQDRSTILAMPNRSTPATGSAKRRKQFSILHQPSKMQLIDRTIEGVIDCPCRLPACCDQQSDTAGSAADVVQAAVRAVFGGP